MRRLVRSPLVLVAAAAVAAAVSRVHPPTAPSHRDHCPCPPHGRPLAGAAGKRAGAAPEAGDGGAAKRPRASPSSDDAGAAAAAHPAPPAAAAPVSAELQAQLQKVDADRAALRDGERSVAWAVVACGSGRTPWRHDRCPRGGWECSRGPAASNRRRRAATVRASVPRVRRHAPSVPRAVRGLRGGEG